MNSKANGFGRKTSLNFGEDLFFFFFFGDHLILGEKIVRISDFGWKITLNFGEDNQTFEDLAPPIKNPGYAYGIYNMTEYQVPRAQVKDFFCYIWQEDVAKISKVPEAPGNVNQARVITWLVGVTN